MLDFQSIGKRIEAISLWWSKSAWNSDSEDVLQNPLRGKQGNAIQQWLMNASQNDEFDKTWLEHHEHYYRDTGLLALLDHQSALLP
ncbi:MAG TPA: hypothetical protein V6C84_28745 [Coleofasciculaceae cyanobacterium]